MLVDPPALIRDLEKSLASSLFLPVARTIPVIVCIWVGGGVVYGYGLGGNTCVGMVVVLFWGGGGRVAGLGGGVVRRGSWGWGPEGGGTPAEGIWGWGPEGGGTPAGGIPCGRSGPAGGGFGLDGGGLLPLEDAAWRFPLVGPEGAGSPGGPGNPGIPGWGYGYGAGAGTGAGAGYRGGDCGLLLPGSGLYTVSIGPINSPSYSWSTRGQNLKQLRKLPQLIHIEITHKSPESKRALSDDQKQISLH